MEIQHSPYHREIIADSAVVAPVQVVPTPDLEAVKAPEPEVVEATEPEVVEVPDLVAG